MFIKNLKSKTKYENENKNRNYPSPIREWKNSIYVYNKNALDLIPVTNNLAIKLIKSYLYIFSIKLDRIRNKKRMLRRFRKLATTRIYSSKSEHMHTNNKVTITLNIYNKQSYNILRIIKKNMANKWRGFVKLKFLRKKIDIKKINFYTHKKLIKKHFLYRIFYFIKWRQILLKNIFYLKKTYLKIFFKDLINKNLDKNFILYFHIYLDKFLHEFTKKKLKKLKLYFYYKQIYYINKSKFNYTYLQHLTNLLHKIYNKNIEYNIINLKYLYFNSDILSEVFTLKIRKNRRKTLRFLKKLIKKVKVGKSYKSIYNPEIKKNFIYNALKDCFHEKKKKVLNLIKYKKLTGVRLEASGRLTRRYTASRSVYRYKYKGNLLNEESSYEKQSSVILKGNQIPNLQYSFIKHKTRIGSFGVKGWISGN